MRRPVRSIQTTYGGIRYRSRTEARWGLLFDAIGIRFGYEPEGFETSRGPYLPDFWLHDLNLYVEVKGQEPTADEAAKCEEVSRATERDFLIAIGSPDERHQLIWFDREGRREGEYLLAQDRIAACGFWLVDDLGRGNWIGPNRTGFTPRGPMLSGALEQAVSLARAERFDSPATRNRRVEPLPHAEDRLAEWFDGAAA